MSKYRVKWTTREGESLQWDTSSETEAYRFIMQREHEWSVWYLFGYRSERKKWYCLNSSE